MKEVIRSADPRVAALIARQATQSPASDGLGLERVRALLERLGRPQDRLPPVFHVAGTNGKGSTCAFLRAGLEAAGRRVHVFTSPHLVRYNERIRIAGTLIDDATLARLMDQVLDANDEVGGSLFEVNVAVAFLAFAEVPADACILEVGLGGRLDATNVIEQPLVTGIASLGLDHQAFLGNTLRQVAAEKAGIAKAGVPLVLLRPEPDALAPIEEVAARVGAPLLLEGRDWQPLDDLQPSLPGPHQRRNANLAWAMLSAQRAVPVELSTFKRAIGRVKWPARLQRLADGPLVDSLPPGSDLWVDGGHNPSAAQLVAEHIAATWSYDLPLTILFASLASKDARGTLSPFAPLGPRVITLPIDGHECRDPLDLSRMAAGMGLTAEPAPDLRTALAVVRATSRVLVFGSLYLAGEALSANGSLPD